MVASFAVSLFLFIVKKFIFGSFKLISLKSFLNHVCLEQVITAHAFDKKQPFFKVGKVYCKITLN